MGEILERVASARETACAARAAVDEHAADRPAGVRAASEGCTPCRAPGAPPGEIGLGFDRALELLAGALDACASSEPVDLGHGDRVIRLAREVTRLDAVLGRTLAAFASSGEHAADGARSVTAWVVHKTKLARADVHRLLRLGRASGDLPAFGSAWADGTVSTAQFALVAPMLEQRTREAVLRGEQILLDDARTFDHRRFARLCAYFAQCADPDGCEKGAEGRRRARDVRLYPSISGTYLGTITLDELSGATVAGELDRLEALLFEQDHAEAAARLGRRATTSELARTAAERRADALVEMATRSRSTPANARRPLPLVTVLVGYETLYGKICELEDGTLVTPGSVLGLLERAEIERAVFAPGRRIEIGIRTRLFSGATRRAIELRDRSCTHPLCDEPLRRCEVDHIVPFSMGGTTTQENGRLLCGFHNRLRNHRRDGDGDGDREPADPTENADDGGRPPPGVGTTRPST